MLSTVKACTELGANGDNTACRVPIEGVCKLWGPPSLEVKAMDKLCQATSEMTYTVLSGALNYSNQQIKPHIFSMTNGISQPSAELPATGLNCFYLLN